jgi:hypothetical protein
MEKLEEVTNCQKPEHFYKLKKPPRRKYLGRERGRTVPATPPPLTHTHTHTHTYIYIYTYLLHGAESFLRS